MGKLAIIGGTGLKSLPYDNIKKVDILDRKFGDTGAELTQTTINDNTVYFLNRHGDGNNKHRVPPHKVNYRANVWALHEQGVESIIAITVVGGITEDAAPGFFIVPDQIIDYTYDRKFTFFEDNDLDIPVHTDFSYPYCNKLRAAVIAAIKTLEQENPGQYPLTETGVYGATQGPRYETAAEINRYERDGCTIVGMTGMPEAILARELGMRYVNLSLVVNWAAGRNNGKDIDESELLNFLAEKQKLITNILTKTIASYNE